MIFLIAAAGSIFFFPMNIGGRYTCFYHRLFDPPQAESGLNASINNQGKILSGHTNQMNGHDHSVLLDNYLHQYAFIWWGSVGILALCIYIFFKIKKDIKVNDPNLTVK